MQVAPASWPVHASEARGRNISPAAIVDTISPEGTLASLTAFKTLAVAALMATTALAQNIVGTWQGTLTTPQRALRLVMKVTRAGDESLKATFYSIDQNGQGIPAASVSLQGTAFKAA